MGQLAGLFDTGTRLMLLATALGFMSLEYLLGRLTRHDTHDTFESVASLGVAAGQSVVRAGEAALLAVPFAFVYQHRLFDFSPTAPLALAALFVATEFAYYGSIAPRTASTGCGRRMRCIIRRRN